MAKARGQNRSSGSATPRRGSERAVVGDSSPSAAPAGRAPSPVGRASALLDTRVIYCGDNLEQLAKLPDACIDLIYIDPPFNSKRRCSFYKHGDLRTGVYIVVNFECIAILDV